MMITCCVAHLAQRQPKQLLINLTSQRAEKLQFAFELILEMTLFKV